MAEVSLVVDPVQRHHASPPRLEIVGPHAHVLLGGDDVVGDAVAALGAVHPLAQVDGGVVASGAQPALLEDALPVRPPVLQPALVPIAVLKQIYLETIRSLAFNMRSVSEHLLQDDPVALEPVRHPLPLENGSVLRGQSALAVLLILSHLAFVALACNRNLELAY